jgi:AmmeMemoRadiSam system protein B
MPKSPKPIWKVYFIVAGLCAMLGGCPDKPGATGTVPVVRTAAAAQKNGGAMDTMAKAFEPVVAGSFYPGSNNELLPMVKKYLDAAADAKLQGRLLGLVSPHAGYIYSGPAAAWAYRQLVGRKLSVAVVMAPSHRFRGDAAAILDRPAYRTPLGEVKIARDMVEMLKKSRFFTTQDRMFAMEHSLEVQLPFLQTVEPDLPIVPIILPTHDKAVLDGVATELFNTFKQANAVFIASSDMSHYHPYEENNRIDAGSFKVMQKMDPGELLGGERTGAVELCGLAPVYVLWKLAELSGGGKMTILKHENSGDTAGDRSGVVGYGAIAVTVGDKAK